jgi:hypothetical protein
MQAVEDTEFFPAWGRARLEAMMKSRPDWCVSRQRNWGVPIPSSCTRPPANCIRAARNCWKKSPSGRETGHRGLVQPGSEGTARRRRGKLRQEPGHPGRLVRFRRHPRLPAEGTGRSQAPGRPLSGRLGPASRLVPVQPAHRLRHRRPRALRGPAHPRLRRRRQGHEDVQVQGQRHRAPEGHPTPTAPTSCACGWPAPTTPAN